MKHRFRLPLALLLAVVAVVAACTDRPAPTAPVLQRIHASADAQMATCTTIANLTSLVNQVFGAGSPNARSALGKLSEMQKEVREGDQKDAQEDARKLIRFIQLKAGSLPGQQYVDQLIAAIECYVGLREDTFLVYPSDQPQVLVAAGGTAGVQLPANPVTEPTLITIDILPDTATGVLDTKLDKYPGFIRITQTSGVGNSLVAPVVVAVCPAPNIPAAVLERLRLGHQKSTGFEVTPDADASFLDCSGVAPLIGAASNMPGWVRSLASLVVPKQLYAYVPTSMINFGGGVGGTVTEFSPFGPVDPELSFGGGVGGTVTEFIRTPAPSTTPTPANDPNNRKAKTPAAKPRSAAAPVGMTMVAGAQAALLSPEACSTGVVGTSLATECRPQVTITTANGTVLQNVPVTFTLGLGGGTTAIDNPTTRACGTAGASASTTTNANGKAGACWTLGATAGPNTLIATASAGGDAPEGVYFTPGTKTFTVTAIKSTASLALSDLNQTYTGSPIGATVTTTPAGLSTVNVTYNGSATQPTDAGSYSVVATLDNPSFEATATGTFVIGRATQSALSVSGPATAAFGDAATQLGAVGGSGTGALSFSAGASTACSVTSGGLLTITSGTGSCDVTATKASDSNYESVTSAPFSVTPAKAAASIALSDLSYTYGGSARSATATTTPANLSGVSITYDGSALAPTDAGNYAVVATLTNADFSATPATGTLVIAQASQSTLSITGGSTIAFGGSSVQLATAGGSGTGAVTFSAGASTACSATTDGAVTATSGTGSCDITAAKAGDNNHEATSSAVFPLTVSKASATLTLGDLSATYNGTTKSASVTSSPVVSGISVTYDGGASAPTDAGNYAVVATLINADYEATPATGTLVIAKAGQLSFTLAAPASATYGAGPVQLSALGGSGNGAVTFASLSAAACSVNSSTGAVSLLTGVGSCIVSATKAGDLNHESITSASATIALVQASQSISFAPLSGKTYGDAAFTVSATATSGLPLSFTTVAGSNCSVTGSTVSATGAGNCTVLASQSGDASFYSAAVPVSQSFAIAKRAATATAGSGTMSAGSAVPSLPCSVNGLLTADAGTVTCTTSMPSSLTAGTYATTPVISPAVPANYAVTSVNGTLTVTSAYIQRNCFAAPIITSVNPPATTGITKGTTIEVKCRLVDASGRNIWNATGNLRVEDRGTNGLATPTVVFNGTNVFRRRDDDSDRNDDDRHYYSYYLSTSPTAFVKGRYYFVVATWNDGSTTRGWFKLK